MKYPIASLPYFTASFTAVALLSGCMENNTSNEDEAVTTVTESVAGQSLGSGFNQTQDWNDLSKNPIDSTLLENDILGQSGITSGASLAKRSSVQGDSLVVNLNDTAQGRATLTYSNTFLGIKSEAVVVAKWDEKAKDNIKDNENILSYSLTKTFPNGHLEKTEIKDADGDGLVNAAAGAKSLVEIVFSKTEGLRVETADLIVGTGPDGDFNNDADNTIEKATWTRNVNGSLKADAAYLDGDNDGIVLFNDKPSIILIHFNSYEPLDRPFVKSVQATAKIRYLGKNKGHIPLNFGFIETLRNGRVNQISMKNRLGGDDMVAGDTLIVHLETKLTAQDDTLKYAAVDYVMNPGSDLKSNTDDSLYAIHIQTQKRKGAERESEFHFWSAHPVLQGQKPTSGKFEGMATYAGGKSAHLKGEFSPNGFAAEYTGPNGKTITVEYGLTGNVITQP